MITIFLLFQLGLGGDVLEVDAFKTLQECETAKTEAATYYDVAERSVPSFKRPRMECQETAVHKPGEPA